MVGSSSNTAAAAPAARDREIVSERHATQPIAPTEAGESSQDSSARDDCLRIARWRRYAPTRGGTHKEEEGHGCTKEEKPRPGWGVSTRLMD